MNTTEYSNELDLLLPIIAGAVLVLLLICFVMVFIFLYHKAQMRLYAERQKFEQALLETEIEIKEQTLQEVAVELHDNIGQIASLLKINLNLIGKDQDTINGSELISESNQLIQQLITDIKSLSSILDQDRIKKMDLSLAIKEMAVRINNTGVLDVKVADAIVGLYIQADTRLLLYRMSQEIINNTLKHAEASFLRIVLIEEDQSLKLLFEDDGKGFELNPANNLGQGLSNLQKRAKLINASITIKSNLGRGTAISIILPLKS